MKKVPSERTLLAWRASIDKQGVARIKLRTLLKQFGLLKRGTNTEIQVEDWLVQHHLFPRGFGEKGLDGSVQLTSQPIETIGALYTLEKDLEKRFPNELAGKLKLKDPQGEYSPRGTRDRMDFLCLDHEGRAVVVELKCDAGDKRAVEQVLRYIGQLKHEGGHKAPRGVLITGCADPDTRRALEGLDQDSHIDWWIYGLVGGESKLKLKQIKYRKVPGRT